jgi:hypothetical protein
MEDKQKQEPPADPTVNKISKEAFAMGSQIVTFVSYLTNNKVDDYKFYVSLVGIAMLVACATINIFETMLVDSTCICTCLCLSKRTPTDSDSERKTEQKAADKKKLHDEATTTKQLQILTALKEKFQGEKVGDDRLIEILTEMRRLEAEIEKAVEAGKYARALRDAAGVPAKENARNTGSSPKDVETMATIVDQLKAQEGQRSPYTSLKSALGTLDTEQGNSGRMPPISGGAAESTLDSVLSGGAEETKANGGAEETKANQDVPVDVEQGNSNKMPPVHSGASAEVLPASSSKFTSPSLSPLGPNNSRTGEPTAPTSNNASTNMSAAVWTYQGFQYLYNCAVALSTTAKQQEPEEFYKFRIAVQDQCNREAAAEAAARREKSIYMGQLSLQERAAAEEGWKRRELLESQLAAAGPRSVLDEQQLKVQRQKDKRRSDLRTGMSYMWFFASVLLTIVSSSNLPAAG